MENNLQITIRGEWELKSEHRAKIESMVRNLNFAEHESPSLVVEALNESGQHVRVVFKAGNLHFEEEIKPERTETFSRAAVGAMEEIARKIKQKRASEKGRR